VTPVELLQQLIRLDTTNPPGNEYECVGFVRNVLEEAGCETQAYSKDTDRPNLVARLHGAGDSPPLLLQGHVDTRALQRF
jgi:acetylornithine deacetylase/succinyl-diaminopimelate desuccinylase-like protein